MRFHVPQFIEVEDKIFGPLTVKQFIYLAGTGGFVIILYFLVPFWLTFLLGVPVVGLGLALAFYKVHNRPFVHVLEAMVHYVFSSKLYLWEKKPSRAKKKQKEERASKADVSVPTLSRSKLKDLAWNLDVKESDIYSNKEQR